MLDRAMSEADLQQTVIEMARVYGWLVAHFRPARTAKGWRTAIEGDAGFPDLVLVRDGRVLFVELKQENGKPSAAQGRWLSELCPTRECARRVEVYVWRPSDLPSIPDVLYPP